MSKATPITEGTSKGDWYCKNCGYIADTRVTHSETCDTCHEPVRWHAFDVQQSVYFAAPVLLAACKEGAVRLEQAMELLQRDSSPSADLVRRYCERARDMSKAAIAQATEGEA